MYVSSRRETFDPIARIQDVILSMPKDTEARQMGGTRANAPAATIAAMLVQRRPVCRRSRRTNYISCCQMKPPKTERSAKKGSKIYAWKIK